MLLKKEYLGEFVNESGVFMVSDPCYEIGTWCQGQLNDVATGKWSAYVNKSDEGEWGIRCAELVVEHESIEDAGELSIEVCSFEVGVDSGQAGIFDLKYYANDEAFASEENPENKFGDTKFYNFCCDLTLSEISAGVIKYGAVSSSGYGDGAYKCFALKNKKGKIVSVTIIFLDEEDEDGNE